MTAGPDRPVAILDANVLYPFRKRDVLLRLAHVGLFQVRWTERILEEWTSRLLAAKPHLEGSVRSQLAAMAQAFPDALVTGHEALEDALALPDPDDRHVLAAAIMSRTDVVVTDNLRDFPPAAVEPLDIEAMTADAFLAHLHDLHPDEVLAAMRALRRAYRHPPYSPGELLRDLAAKGLPELAARLGGREDHL